MELKGGTVIIAPHPDDELIGCYTILKRGVVDTVIFVSPEQTPRRREAILAAKHFGAKAIFTDSVGRIKKICKGKHVFLPSQRDAHPLHRKVSAYADFLEKVASVHFYTVDKTPPFFILNGSDQTEKRKLLNQLYPSQKKLWERDDKYVLFEGFKKIDQTVWASVSFEFENTHRWHTIPNTHPKQFLKNPHRHIFKCNVWIEQYHEDRDIEYLEAKDLLKRMFFDNSPRTKDKSCEMIARDIYSFLRKTYGWERRYKVTVTEDGENGALIE